MKKLTMLTAAVMAMMVLAGCFTSATARTKRTATDGTVTESYVSIVGTGDKASEVAAEGLFADGAESDLGAGVKKATASQQSTGIEGTLAGMGTLMQGMAQFVMAAQAAKTAGTATAFQDTATDKDAQEYIPAPSYSPDGYDGTPGADGVGVYGRPSCSRCQAYKKAHPDTALITIETEANQKTMWAALRQRGYSGKSVLLPVEITAAGYVAQAK